MNLWRELPPGPDWPRIIYVVVEIPKGSRNKHEYDEEGGFVKLDRVLFSSLHYPGDYNILVPSHRDIDHRAAVLEKVGVDKQILTFTTPGTHIEEPARSVELAQITNDGFARIKFDFHDLNVIADDLVIDFM